MGAALAALMILHPLMEKLVDFETGEIPERGQFKLLHRTYLWVSTVQWIAGLVYTALTLIAWRREASTARP
jgi:hypothetical protein